MTYSIDLIQNNVPANQQQQKQSAIQGSELESVSQALTLPSLRKGIHDKEVEVWVDGEFKNTYLSQVQIGQPWHSLEGAHGDRWFVCLSPVRFDYSRDQKNPTLIMGAMNVLQAESVQSRIHKPKLSTAKGVPKLSSNYDVEDIELEERR